MNQKEDEKTSHLGNPEDPTLARYSPRESEHLRSNHENASGITKLMLLLVGGIVGFLLASFAFKNEGPNAYGPGLLATFLGAFLTTFPYLTLVREFSRSALEKGDATVGVFVLRGSIYMILGGLVVLIMGLASLCSVVEAAIDGHMAIHETNEMNIKAA